MKSQKIVVVGGGTAGMSVVNWISRKSLSKDIVIIEPSDVHYYQPLWTLVGGGILPLKNSARPMEEYIPSGVNWIKEYVASFHPEKNLVITKSGQEISYDYLIVAAGIQLNWKNVDGLKETLGKNGVCSNYSEKTVDYTWECIQKCDSGNAIFTQPNTPIKCAGAPQKIMWLAEETFRDKKSRKSIEVVFASGGASIFGIKKYREALEPLVKDRNIKTLFQHNLISIDGPNKKATFENLATKEKVTLDYNMIHVTPPMGPPDFIKGSSIANADGWVDVDKYTLQHTKYLNIFSLGDCSSLPTSRTGAAVRKQAPVLLENLRLVMGGKIPTHKYDGYSSCPLVTGRGKVILAEFDYDGNPAETFPFDQGKERLSMYLLKKFVIPFMYWHAMLRGYF
jgi:sulfide:quinone oxidoreductase